MDIVVVYTNNILMQVYDVQSNNTLVHIIEREVQ